MKKVTRYTLAFIISSFLLLTALSIDNLLWVPGAPEWEGQGIVHQYIFGVETGRYWVGPVQDYDTLEMFDYLINYRIVSVWTHVADIGAAIITGFLVMLSLMVRDKIKKERRWRKQRGEYEFRR